MRPWLLTASLVTVTSLLSPSRVWVGRSRSSLLLAAAQTQPQDPGSLVREGMAQFRRGDVESSIRSFDEAITADGRYAGLLWQRGLSLYYAELFDEGAVQFRRDVALNPSDTEEAIWTMLCEARNPSIGFEEARRRLLKVGRDRRPYMRVAYDMFAGTATEQDLAAEGHRAGPGSAPEFYSQLYLGLLAEVKGDETKARSYITTAVASPYGTKSNDYMWALARVHKDRRGW